MFPTDACCAKDGCCLARPCPRRRYFLELVALRVQQPDCVVSGWLLDGFPHTEEQAMALQRLGLVPDKVVFLTASQSVLLDRTRYRRIDMDTNRVYHMATEGALSQPIRPLTKDGVLDQEVVARWVLQCSRCWAWVHVSRVEWFKCLLGLKCYACH